MRTRDLTSLLVRGEQSAENALLALVRPAGDRFPV
jgi:hypothetical protein